MKKNMIEKKKKAIRDFFAILPHSQSLGMAIDFIGDGEVGMSMPYDSKLIGDPQTKVIHGGAVFALLDTCCGSAAMSHPDQEGPTATIDLRVDYMRPATPSQRIKAIATCYNLTKNVAFVRAVALDYNEEKPVAMAAGAFVTGS
jgi:uncharacterized protein (TIGR00369 family)